MSILPDGETLPTTTGGGNYLNKFEDGKTRFRILETPVLTFFEAWEDTEDGSMPVRAKTLQEVEAHGYRKEGKFGVETPKYKWAVKVFHYNDPNSPSEGGEVKILTFHQRGIMQAIQDNSLTDDWADPTKYDITVTRTGKDKETKYTVTNSIPKPLQEEVDPASIDLDKLLTNEDPFGENPDPIL